MTDSEQIAAGSKGGRRDQRFGGSTGLYVLNGALTAALFALDLSLELGVAGGVLYVAVVGLSAWMPGARSTLGFGAVATVLTLLGYFASPVGGELWKVLANRTVSVFAIWVTGALVLHQKRLGARRDRAEERAARSEQQVRLAVESSPSGMLLVDRGGRIVLVNAESERLFGYKRDELLGQPVEMLVPDRYRDAHPSHRAAFLAEPEPRRLGAGREIHGARKDGREVGVEIGLAHIETQGGKFVLVTVADVSDRKQLEEVRQARALGLRLFAAEETQRRRMARNIHDALGQALTALKLDIGWLAARLPEGDASLRDRAKAMEELATDTIQEVRRLSAELRPAVLDDCGLVAAIRWHVGDFEKRTGLRCALALPAREISWGEERCAAAFRVLQEALTNIMRHAQAEKVAVALWQEEQGDAALEVRDDGCGISAEQVFGKDSLGLLGMRERALLHGGTLTVDGIPGGGTMLILRMPCEPACQGEGI
jgi:PAS domain S-box-containing protein